MLRFLTKNVVMKNFDAIIWVFGNKVNLLCWLLKEYVTGKNNRYRKFIYPGDNDVIPAMMLYSQKH